MGIFERLALTHSWPLAEQGRRFDLGRVLDSLITDGMPPLLVGEVGDHHAGCWECDLEDDSLIWSGGVYDIFGLPRGTPLTRDEAVALYAEESRVKMEQLRAYAIRHRRGFTLDAEVCPAVGGRRWMRLICAPVLDGDRPVRLHGLKLLI
jgi:PAS domain-containing protein